MGIIGFIFYIKIKSKHDVIPMPDVTGGACNNTADNSTIVKRLTTL